MGVNARASTHPLVFLTANNTGSNRDGVVTCVEGIDLAVDPVEGTLLDDCVVLAVLLLQRGSVQLDAEIARADGDHFGAGVPLHCDHAGLERPYSGSLPPVHLLLVVPDVGMVACRADRELVPRGTPLPAKHRLLVLANRDVLLPFVVFQVVNEDRPVVAPCQDSVFRTPLQRRDLHALVLDPPHRFPAFHLLNLVVREDFDRVELFQRNRDVFPVRRKTVAQSLKTRSLSHAQYFLLAQVGRNIYRH